MFKKTSKLILFLGILFCFLLKAGFVFALETTYPPIFGFSLNSTPTLAEYAKYLFNIGMSLSVILAVIIVAFGGIYYLISYGKGSFTSEAKDWIRAGILGLLIIVSAYLVVGIINPGLLFFEINGLPRIGLWNPLTGSGRLTTKITTYKEIPLGVLTETLLTRKISCYGFDQEGNPIDGEKIKPDDGEEVVGPTYMDHDRADCLLQLIDGAQKKAQVISKLSDAINVEMNKCDCEKYGNCGQVCNGTCNGYTKCPGGACKPSDCIGGACKQPANNKPPDCCPTDSGIQDPKNNKRNLSVKELIEHGPIKIVWADNCRIPKKTYAGLDEFRSDYNNNYDQIKDKVEKKPVIKVDKKEIYRIDYGDCKKCTYTCQSCDPIKLTGQAMTNCLTALEKCEKDFNKCQTDLVDCQKKSPWGKLKLIDQLTYFKGKTEEMKKKIEDDKKILEEARNTLSSCYLSIPYVDLIKKLETTKKSDLIILTDKTVFKDPETKVPVDSSRYCNGFNYANSSCLKKCSDMCPDTSNETIKLYKECNKNCGKDDKSEKYKTCIKDQQTCMEKDAYLARPCIYDGKDTHQKFSECISSCQDGCSNNCDTKYATCTQENKTCKIMCTQNSKCVLDNAGSCLIDAQGIVNCTNRNFVDAGNLTKCINVSYPCKNGSNQYAGYEDCATPIATGISTSINSVVNNCSLFNRSASYFYDNQKCLKCPEPGTPPKEGDFCYSSVDDKNKKNTSIKSTASCQKLCPEVSKCPASSNCPNCPCEQISDPADNTKPLPVIFSLPNKSTGANAGNEGETPLINKILAHQIVGPDCNEYSINDDPLTFYCDTNWWSDPNREGTNMVAIGTEKFCSKGGEIPVGQTVDEAITWADWLIKQTNVDKIKKIIDNMNKAGKAENNQTVKNYCKCDAKYETNKPICKTDCQYSQELVDRDDGKGKKWVCACNFVKCKGNPCDQMIKYLVEIWNTSAELKNDYVNFYTIMLQENSRSDIMKKLTYSRNKTSECSVKTTNFTKEETRMLNCSRVGHEVLPPINTGKIMYNNEAFPNYCYGQKLGNRLNKTLTDNWFCCAQYEKAEE